VALGLVAVLVAWLNSGGARGLRRLGYKRQPNGTWTRVVGDVRVEYRAVGRWTVRTGLYASSDFVAEPKRGRRHGEYTFESGVPALDRRFWFWSERPPFAKLLLERPSVQKAMLAFPRAALITLKGDELVVQVKRRQWPNHERVVRLARAIAASARPD
jgi:hypothetical protein